MTRTARPALAPRLYTVRTSPLRLRPTCCNDSPSGRLLFRKKQQTRAEGTPARRMQRSSPDASVECTARHHALLHSSFLFHVCVRAQAAATPSDFFGSAVPAADASNIGGRAQRRCKYARCTPLVPHPSLPPRKPSNPRHTLHLFMC